MSPPFSTETERRISLLFSPETRDEATRLLIEQSGNNLPSSKALTSFSWSVLDSQR
jgi:hypothetical protein